MIRFVVWNNEFQFSSNSNFSYELNPPPILVVFNIEKCFRITFASLLQLFQPLWFEEKTSHSRRRHSTSTTSMQSRIWKAFFCTAPTRRKNFHCRNFPPPTLSLFHPNKKKQDIKELRNWNREKEKKLCSRATFLFRDWVFHSIQHSVCNFPLLRERRKIRENFNFFFFSLFSPSWEFRQYVSWNFRRIQGEEGKIVEISESLAHQSSEREESARIRPQQITLIDGFHFLRRFCFLSVWLCNH